MRSRKEQRVQEGAIQIDDDSQPPADVGDDSFEGSELQQRISEMKVSLESIGTVISTWSVEPGKYTNSLIDAIDDLKISVAAAQSFFGTAQPTNTMADRFTDVMDNLGREYADLKNAIDNYIESKNKPSVKRAASDPPSPPPPKTSKTDDEGPHEEPMPDSQPPWDSQMQY